MVEALFLVTNKLVLFKNPIPQIYFITFAARLRVRQLGVVIEARVRRDPEARSLLRIKASSGHHVGRKFPQTRVPLGQLRPEERICGSIFYR